MDVHRHILYWYLVVVLIICTILRTRTWLVVTDISYEYWGTGVYLYI